MKFLIKITYFTIHKNFSNLQIKIRGLKGYKVKLYDHLLHLYFEKVRKCNAFFSHSMVLRSKSIITTTKIEYTSNNFHRFSFWIEVHGLPRKIMTKEADIQLTKNLYECMAFQSRERFDDAMKIFPFKCKIGH